VSLADSASFAAGLDRSLAKHGVSAGTQRATTLASAIELAHPGGVLELYWLARISMLSDLRDLDGFHAAFLETANGLADARLLQSLVAGATPRRNDVRPAATQDRIVPPPPSEETADASDEAAVFRAMASPDERLSKRDFAEMDDAERALALKALERFRMALELRKSRRRRAGRRGDRLDVRATMRGAARTAGELMRRRASARREAARPLVFLCDVSGSMIPYARALLQYARVAARARPKVRAFAFATELTELTVIARRASTADVMNAFAAALRDYGGGTRIGAALRDFNERYAQRGAARGGTVVILSDGWERDDPGLVGREMARLRRLARKIVWVNPQKKHLAFEPLAAGMAAAVPYVDVLIAGHNLHSLDAIADAIENTVPA
jgi:uncharacterized protein with von Willebrand factor type A (vWA) domain